MTHSCWKAEQPQEGAEHGKHCRHIFWGQIAWVWACPCAAFPAGTPRDLWDASLPQTTGYLAEFSCPAMQNLKGGPGRAKHHPTAGAGCCEPPPGPSRSLSHGDVRFKTKRLLPSPAFALWGLSIITLFPNQTAQPQIPLVWLVSAVSTAVPSPASGLEVDSEHPEQLLASPTVGYDCSHGCGVTSWKNQLPKS